MPFDIDQLTPEERERYHTLGQKYKTPDVLAQASKTLRAHELYGLLLVLCGFGLDDGALLLELRDLLRETDGGHLQAVDDRKLLGNTYASAKQEAKDERSSARTLASLIVSPLNRLGQTELAQRTSLALKQTSKVEGDKQLLDQLKSLHELLSLPEMAEVIANRGGPQIVAGLKSSHDTLLALVQQRAGQPEVPAAAARRDILDGAVVSLCRAARDASKIAARRLGRPEIAEAFKLDLLRRSRKGGAPAAPVEEVEDVPTSDFPEPAL